MKRDLDGHLASDFHSRACSAGAHDTLFSVCNYSAACTEQPTRDEQVKTERRRRRKDRQGSFSRDVITEQSNVIAAQSLTVFRSFS